MSDSVTCIIPAFNMAGYVGEAIESVLAQTRRPDEIIVIDDGSKDRTADEVARFGEAVAYVRQANAGVSAARNRGLKRARGNLICFLDADDRYDGAKTEKQFAAFASDPGLQFCDGHSRCFWSDDMPDEARRADPRWHSPFWREERPGHIGTWLVRREVFHSIGTFDESLRFSEDTDWLLRMRDAGIARLTLPDCLGLRRLHAGNVTAGDRRGQVDGLARAYLRSRARKRATGA